MEDFMRELAPTVWPLKDRTCKSQVLILVRTEHVLHRCDHSSFLLHGSLRRQSRFVQREEWQSLWSFLGHVQRGVQSVRILLSAPLRYVPQRQHDEERMARALLSLLASAGFHWRTRHLPSTVGEQTATEMPRLERRHDEQSEEVYQDEATRRPIHWHTSEKRHRLGITAIIYSAHPYKRCFYLLSVNDNDPSLSSCFSKAPANIFRSRRISLLQLNASVTTMKMVMQPCPCVYRRFT